MIRVNHIYSQLAVTHSLTFWLPETAWLCHLVTHSSIHATCMHIYSVTFFFPVLPFQLNLFQSCTHTEEYLTSYIRIFIIFCNVSFYILVVISYIIFIFVCIAFFWMFFCPHHLHRLLFNNEPTWIEGAKYSTNNPTEVYVHR